MKKILLAAFICCIFSCSKEVFKNSSIIGKWKLEEYYLDPGDGSHQWQKPDGLYTIEFTTEGDYISTGNNETVIGKFSIIDSSTISVVETSPGSNNYTFHYSLSSNNAELILNGQCIEGCASRYVAIKK